MTINIFILGEKRCLRLAKRLTKLKNKQMTSETCYKGVILVGGPSTGTRFRPLSMDLPKPLFPVAGNPIIYHHIAALAKIQGMEEIFLIGFYEQAVFDSFLKDVQAEFPFIVIR